MRIEADGAGILLEPARETMRVQAWTAWAKAEFAEPLAPGELDGWTLALQKFADQDAGSLELQTGANGVRLVFAMAKKGELHVSVRLQQGPDFAHELRLFLLARRSDLPELIARLGAERGPSPRFPL